MVLGEVSQCGVMCVWGGGEGGVVIQVQRVYVGQVVVARLNQKSRMH